MKLEKVLAFNKKDDSDGITINFIYSYKTKNNKYNYFGLFNKLKFKDKNDLNYSEFQTSSIFKNDFNIDYSKSLDEILKQIYPDNNYKVLWSAEN